MSGENRGNEGTVIISVKCGQILDETDKYHENTQEKDPGWIRR